MEPTVGQLFGVLALIVIFIMVPIKFIAMGGYKRKRKCG